VNRHRKGVFADRSELHETPYDWQRMLRHSNSRGNSRVMWPAASQNTLNQNAILPLEL
jgi:hypothetical protein